VTQERLDGLALLSFEREEASVIDCNEFIAEFARVKSRKVGGAILVGDFFFCIPWEAEVP
jgi:hypothetical protein